ncbi:hypothetical protein PZH43_13390, partial [Streptococcus gordonii]|nr:hypothetical protein [Streptococcus gordonii]
SLDDLPGDNRAYWEGVFGDLDSPDMKQHFLTSMVAELDKKTKFYAWCGEQDFLYKANQVAVKELKKLGLKLDYIHLVRIMGIIKIAKLHRNDRFIKGNPLI